jgi:hypothetical protein
MDTLFAGPTKVLGIITKPINPFPKTMSNLINAAIDYTPYGSLRAEGWNLGTAIAKSDRYPQQFLREAPERGTPEYYALHARAVAGTAAMGSLYMAMMAAVKEFRHRQQSRQHRKEHKASLARFYLITHRLFFSSAPTAQREGVTF